MALSSLWTTVTWNNYNYCNAPINVKLQHPPAHRPRQTLGVWTSEDCIVQIPAPSHQNDVEMPYTIVAFLGQTPLWKNNHCWFLPSLIKLVYKPANTCFVTLYDPLWCLKILNNFRNVKFWFQKLEILRLETWNFKYANSKFWVSKLIIIIWLSKQQISSL